MWIYVNNLDQVIWLADNWKWVWHLNLFSRTRVKNFDAKTVMQMSTNAMEGKTKVCTYKFKSENRIHLSIHICMCTINIHWNLHFNTMYMSNRYTRKPEYWKTWANKTPLRFKMVGIFLISPHFWWVPQQCFHGKIRKILYLELCIWDFRV